MVSNFKKTHILHGGDYNPDQWLKTPDIWDEDIRLMKVAKWNTVTLGVFSWANLEPEEGKYTFDWLDTIMDKLHANDIKVILATPSAGLPQWLMNTYTEVMIVQQDRIRQLPGKRGKHCNTSPIFREKTNLINSKLAERYSEHPALIMWHVSNEFFCDCHCELCQKEFREWLKRKYVTLDNLNQTWWTSFWSHTFTDWSQIQSPNPNGEDMIHGLNLDWKRFSTFQLVDYIKNEISPLREFTPNIPITTNFMNTTSDIIKVDSKFNHWEIAKVLDFISIDVYPNWHGKREDWKLACEESFTFDICRPMKKGKPFYLMETTPSITNWMPINKLKRPGMHKLSSLLPVAHGSDSLLYFQWRKSRGGFEKFHGAVLDHSGYENNRVFKEVAELGDILSKIDEITNSTVKAEVALIFDYENAWALEDAAGPRENKAYQETCMEHYRQFWGKGISVDVINMEYDFSEYKLIIAPMLYMVKPGVTERMEKFVSEGGTLVATYWSGIVDENDLCFLGGFPGPLRKLLGIWSEEIDTLYDEDSNGIVLQKGNEVGLEGEYVSGFICDLIHSETAEILATYKSDFYEGRPALTVNKFGQGKAYYIASRNEDRFLRDFYILLAKGAGIKKVIDSDLPTGVMIQNRIGKNFEYLFVLNFTKDKKTVNLGNEEFINMQDGKKVTSEITLNMYDVTLLKRKRS